MKKSKIDPKKAKTDKNQRDIDALNMWLGGSSLIEIANHFGVTMASVRSWYARKHWKELREEEIAKAKEVVLQKFNKQVVEMSSCLLESSKTASKIVETAFKKTYQECMTGETVDFELLEKRIESITKISDKLKNFIPHHNELLMNTTSQIHQSKQHGPKEYETFDDELEACLEDEED